MTWATERGPAQDPLARRRRGDFGSVSLLIKSPPVAAAFLLLNDGVGALQKATDAGTAFVFGYRAGAPW
jgi:concentrative nucleoside transporter, CNT family